MMNIRNLDSKESVGVKFEESICTELCLKSSSLKAAGIFVILLSQDGKQLSRKKVLNNHLLNLLQKHPYADVLENKGS